MQVECLPDSQRKQFIRRKRTVSTRKEPVKSLPNGQVSLINKGGKCLAIASRDVADDVGGQSLDRALFDLDQLQSLAARAFDHHRPRIAQLIYLGEEFHVLAPQLGHPGVQIRNAQPNVIVKLA